MLSVQPLHAIVLGSCEKAGRHDAAPHGCGMEPRKRGTVQAEGRGCKNSPCYPQPGVSAQPETMATFHTHKGFFFFFFTAISTVNQAGQGEMAATHAMPLLKRGGGGRKRGVTECTEKNKQS